MMNYEIIAIIILNILTGLSSEYMSNKPSQQWFFQFGSRGIPIRESISRNGAILSMSDTDSSMRDNRLQSFIDESAEDYINENMAKKSALPLVLLGKKYYYFGTYFKTNYYQSLQFCEDHGMNALSIETQIENDYIMDYWKKKFSKIFHFWTSGSDLGEEGTFVWLSTGKALNYTNWIAPQPDNGQKIEHCLEIWKLAENNYIWNDRSCLEKYNFICEVKECNNFCLN